MARSFLGARYTAGLVAVVLVATVLLPAAHAQDPGAPQLRGAFPPDTGRDAPATTQPGPTLPANTTVVPRAPSADGASAGTGQVNLVALLTVDGQRIAGDWSAHSRRASEVAREHFDASRVLPHFLEVACS